MPLYTYRCPNGHRFTVEQSIHEEVKPVVPCELVISNIEKGFRLYDELTASGLVCSIPQMVNPYGKSPCGCDATRDYKSDRPAIGRVPGAGSSPSR